MHITRQKNNSRIFAIFAFFCTLYLIVTANLYYIQIKQHAFFSSLGNKQYHVTITQLPARAPIHDRHGTLLATNKDELSAFIIPNQLKNSAMLLPFLQEHFPTAYQRLQNKKENTSFMFVQRILTPKQITLINNTNIDDIHILKEPSRFYPVASCAPLVGITDIDNKGLFGIEAQCNKQLAGSPTTYNLEKDARSGYFYFAKETAIEGSKGSSITLTIDGTLQFLALEELKKTINQFNAKEGSAIIMDPSTGEILAMVSMPTFNPNDTQTLEIEHTKNRVITESNELGSVFKVFAALAALEEGVVTVDEPIDCHNKTTSYLEGRRVNTWKAQGIIPFSQAIETSNNIGIALIAKRLNEKLYDHLRTLGFGTKSGLDLAGEQEGFVNPPYNWSKQSIISLSYGYEVRATLLQLAQAFCIISNDGCAVTPRFIIDSQQNKISNNSQKLYSDNAITLLKEILRNTTIRGTARRAAIKGYDVMSKTGTANLLEDGKYTFKKNIYTCAGIIEKGDYKRVIATSIKESPRQNLYASQVSAPLFERIAEKLLIHDRQL